MTSLRHRVSVLFLVAAVALAATASVAGAVGTCKTCPNPDFILTPSTIYQTHASTMEQGGCRMYRFTVQASKNYRFTFCEGGGTASFDTILDAFGTSCNALASNDDSCTTKSQLDVTTNAAGYIYLRVTSKLGTAGSYTLAYKDLGIAPSGCVTCPTFDHGTFTPTTSYQNHTSSIGPGGCRIYRFQLSLNHSYRFTFCEGGGSTSFASTLQALTGTCALGPSNTGFCGMGSQVDVAAQSTGYMYVKVSSPSGGSGSFTLAYRDITSDCPACPIFNFGPLKPKTTPATHSSSVSGVGCRVYAFDLGAGVGYHFSLCNNGGSAGFPAMLTLNDPNCAQVASDMTSCNGSDPQVNFTPTTTGRYYLRVAPRVGSGGSYTLAYWSDCPWCDEVTFGPFTPACNTQSIVHVLPLGCTQVYAFNVVGGATYEFSTCNGVTGFDSKLTVLGSSCLVLGTASGGCIGFPSGADAIVTIPGTGATTAYVVVQGEASGLGGPYALEFKVTATSDRDMDGSPDCVDGCPSDGNKTAPGQCGCGVADTDSDMDGAANCIDGCPNDAGKTAPGQCGCGVPDTDNDMDGVANCNDGCPNDANKAAPGQCGCGVPDTDSDMDGVANCNDGCPNDANKTAPGLCGCGVSDIDSDMDGTPNCNDLCPNDANKTAPGTCGCGNPETGDTDMDGVKDCVDGCPNDANKTAPGACGCGVADTDGDMDGVPNCNDGCPNDGNKTAPGLCGCGTPETGDTDMDGVPDCLDLCPDDGNKTAPGVCGCGTPETGDSDDDGTPDCLDGCPNDANKTAPGECGCGTPETGDTDGDTVPDCLDLCPDDANKTAPGLCGCGVAETDSDGDGTVDCLDYCPSDPNKTDPGLCGCNVPDDNTDSDGDGFADCIDGCPNDFNQFFPGPCGCASDPVDCDDGDPCTDDTCDPFLGGCVHEASCCLDGDPCTVDTCDPAQGCQHAPGDCNCNKECPDFDLGPFTPQPPDGFPPFFFLFSEVSGCIEPGCSAVVKFENLDPAKCYMFFICGGPFGAAEFDPVLSGDDGDCSPAGDALEVCGPTPGFLVVTEVAGDLYVRVSAADPMQFGSFTMEYTEGCFF